MTRFADLDLIFGHDSEETALLVDDYPYGRRVRTSIRYWIETVAKRGDRFVSQTLNPKTGNWNKPKKSTYCPIGLMYREADTGYIRWAGLSDWAKAEELADFCSTVGVERLKSEQRIQLSHLIGKERVMRHVSFSIRETTHVAGEPASEREERQAAERAERDAEQKELWAKIQRAITGESFASLKELDPKGAEALLAATKKKAG